MKDVLKIQPNVSNQIQSARMYAKKRKIKKKKTNKQKKKQKTKRKVCYAMLCYVCLSVCRVTENAFSSIDGLESTLNLHRPHHQHHHHHRRHSYPYLRTAARNN